MEITTTSQLCSGVKFSVSSSSSSSATAAVLSLNGRSKRRLKGVVVSLKERDEQKKQLSNVSMITLKEKKKATAVVRRASLEDEENQSTTSGERWLLQPVGDGDTRHIGYKVDMPAPLEFSSGEVTIGRLPEKADLVIPVATVSGVHATISTKGDNLLVTDMNSTNGTFIEDKRLTPGVASPAFPGTRITFGDTNLAIFRVFKLQESTQKPSAE